MSARRDPRARWPCHPAWMVLVVLALQGCGPKDPDATAYDDTAEECAEPYTGPLVNVYDEVYNPDGVWRTCEPPPGSLCFDCHLCANGGATLVENTHFVCNHCHDENGDPLFDSGGCGCGELDCEAEPPLLGCAACHTDGCNGHASAEQMNGLCDFCHVQPEGGAR